MSALPIEVAVLPIERVAELLRMTYTEVATHYRNNAELSHTMHDRALKTGLTIDGATAAEWAAIRDFQLARAQRAEALAAAEVKP
jgi:fermentation-respiration switch protein FrsA (DUF1100 family)